MIGCITGGDKKTKGHALSYASKPELVFEKAVETAERLAAEARYRFECTGLDVGFLCEFAGTLAGRKH